MSGVKFNVGVINYGGLPSGGSGLLAARPAAGVVGRIYIASDSLLLYRDTGSSWATIGGSGGITGSGAAGQATFWTGASAISGDNTFFWDNTNKRLGLGTTTPGVRLDIHGTGVIAQLNGTTTNSAFLDFQNAGVTQWRVGNNYNGALQSFSIYDNSSLHNLLIFKTGTISFNSPDLTGAPFTNYINFYGNNRDSSISLLSYFNSSSGRGIYFFNTRGTTKGTYVATTTGDNLGGLNAYGSSTSGFVQGANVYFQQNGAVGSFIPTDIYFNTSLVSGQQLQLLLNNTGYSTFLSRLNVNNATDNALFSLNNAGNFYTGGLSPVILTVGTNTTMAATATGYFCSATLTLTLPSAAGINNIYWVIAASGATITVNRAGTDDILNLAGASVTSITITPNQRAMFYVGGGTRTFLISQA